MNTFSLIPSIDEEYLIFVHAKTTIYFKNYFVLVKKFNTSTNQIKYY